MLTMDCEGGRTGMLVNPYSVVLVRKLKPSRNHCKADQVELSALDWEVVETGMMVNYCEERKRNIHNH